MQEVDWWYVLYVRSNAEHRVVEELKKIYEHKKGLYKFDVFCPESEKYYRDKTAHIMGKTYLKRPMFPGYVFVETNMPAIEFKCMMYSVICNSSNIIRLLTYGGSNEIAITYDERIRLEYLLKGKRCLEHSIGYIEGDQIIILGGPLIGIEGRIKKINRHHCSAKIELDMFNKKQLIDVALEIVTKR